jgi:hypothetical protein
MILASRGHAWDGDGLADLVVSAPGDRTGVNDGGAIHFFPGPVAPGTVIGDAAGVLAGQHRGAYAGTVLAVVPDTDGDGVDELFVGDENRPTSYSGITGGAYLCMSAPSGTGSLADCELDVAASSVSDRAGSSLAGLGDTDGDGYGDILIGAVFDDTLDRTAGAAYLLRGPRTGDVSLDAAEATILGENAEDYVGIEVDGPGDMDGDGFADVVVTAREAEASAYQGGAVHLFHGPVIGVFVAADADFTAVGTETYGYFRTAASGDVGGDGVVDLLVGAEQEERDGGEGAIHVFSGLAL